jgi:hypothetical protein
MHHQVEETIPVLVALVSGERPGRGKVVKRVVSIRAEAERGHVHPVHVEGGAPLQKDRDQNPLVVDRVERGG